MKHLQSDMEKDKKLYNGNNNKTKRQTILNHVVILRITGSGPL